MSLRLALTLMVAAPAVADALDGSGSLSGTSKLLVHGCGRDRAGFSAALSIETDGTWLAQIAEGDTFAGTSTPVGRSGRRIRLALDDSSTAALVASIEEDVSTVCETQATVTSTRAKTLTLALNRKLTKAKLVVRYAFKGMADGRSGTATYTVVGRGPWTPA